MRDTRPEFRLPSPLGKPARRGDWCGFSICLFVVLLSVFTWMVHRRLTQYELMHQTTGHRLTATKVCLTERPRISVPAIQTMDGTAMFLLAILLAGAFSGIHKSPASSFRRDSVPRPFRLRSRFCMAHFFFLPPPATS